MISLDSLPDIFCRQCRPTPEHGGEKPFLKVFKRDPESGSYNRIFILNIIKLKNQVIVHLRRFFFHTGDDDGYNF